MTSERLSAERLKELRCHASVDEYIGIADEVGLGEVIAELDACRAELAVATAREARLRDMLRESLSAVDFSTYAARTDFFDRARALLAEPDTTSGEEGQ